MSRQDLPKGALPSAGPPIATAFMVTGFSASSTTSAASGSASRKTPRPFSGLVDLGGSRKLYLQSAASPVGEVPDYDSAVEEIHAASPIPAVPAVVLTADRPWNLPVNDAGPTWPA